MRTTLPNQLVTLNISSFKDNNFVDTEIQGLLLRIDDEAIRIITETSEVKCYPIFESEYEEDLEYCIGITISRDEDSIMDFISTVRHYDMEKSLKELADYVSDEFKSIMTVVPESHNTLSEALVNYIKSKFED